MTAPSRRVRDAVWLTCIIVGFVGLAVFFAHYLVTWDGEFGYLVFGRMLMHGEVRLFQDEMTGQRLPLPYYFIGLSQLIAGPNLLAGRLASVGLGALVVGLTFALGRSLSGSPCGFLSALFLVTHGMVVGYYAGASYDSLCSLFIVTGLLAISLERPPWSSVVGMACFSGLSLSRANLAVMVPAVLVYLWLRAHGRRERLALVAAAVLPPLAFLVWSQEHLKILAYMPVVHRFVEPLGYRSLFALQEFPEGRPWVESVWWFIRRHFVWVAATAILAGAAVASRPFRGSGRWPSPPALVLFMGGLTVYALVCQVLILNMYFKGVAAWAPAFAPLWAVVLGYGASVLLTPGAAPTPVRTIVAASLLVLFALGPTWSRHTAMPLVLPAETTTIGVLEAEAARIRSIVPAGRRVFFFGTNPIPAYLAGVSPYLQQVLHTRTFVPSRDDYVVSRSGLWGPRQVDTWLSRDAPYALVEPGLLAVYKNNEPSYRPVIGQIESLLARHFTLVAKGGETPWTPSFLIYARKSPAATAQGQELEPRGGQAGAEDRITHGDHPAPTN